MTGCGIPMILRGSAVVGCGLWIVDCGLWQREGRLWQFGRPVEP